MMNEQYGECNVIVTLGTQKVPAKRRLSQSKSPMNKIARGERCTSVSSNELEDQQEIKERTKWSCHTKVLYNESPYFAALFGENFIESKASLVYLPSSIIDSNAFDSIIYYMYKHEINTPKKVEELCSMYSASDYLGMNTLCNQLIESLYELVHKCLCYCNTCINNVPELFSFCRIRGIEFQDEKMAQMTQRVMTVLANDPEKTLSTYWTGRHMAKLLIQLPQDVSQALSQKILYRVNKSNAIESLYACFSASNILSTNDPLLSWSKPLHATLTSVQSKATLIIARHFDFFCCQYPALLSCIDGITYSFDFLEYLLLHILEDQMDSSNVGILYEGVACDLMSRHAVEYNHQVKHILNVAKVMILCYITRRIGDIRQNGGLDKLEKNVLKLLADDLDVRPKSLISSSHPLSSRGIFSFLIPSIPDLNLSTSTHTNGLSRHSSRSTTTSRRIIVPTNSNPSNSFAKKLKRFLKRFSSHHDTVPRLSNRYASASTVHTTSSSWSHVRLSSNKSFSGKMKQRRRFSTGAAQVSAPLVGMNRRVQLTRRPVLTVGTVMFIGRVNFSEGIWIGVELDRRVGKNDGSVNGHRYFTCSPNRGVFVRPEDVSVVV
ncbi:uncharacterized protein EV154DRAFT_499511 [Mucor mucedo]|uniref:uncharacterized protein n=1 Tax=Mucor mucedo TaxID=29922 RepID=UPI00221E49B3|nr:uncharacterized protein EV154DRAFT_499511 [Mucor mucedo]KAI7894160.1 hypothetical protein EV154DRAFT_499511 [Mucor mucedo]